MKNFATLATLSLAALAGAHADPGGVVPWAPDPLVGVWIADAVRRDCASGNVISPPFKGLQVYHHGGTLTDTNSNPPGTRGPGFGFWGRDSDNRYTAKFRFARYLADGNLDGYTVVTRSITLSVDGNSATGSSRVELRNASDFTFATVCASDTAVRLQ